MARQISPSARHLLTPDEIERIPKLVKQYRDNGYTDWAKLIGLRFGVTASSIRTHYRKWQATSELLSDTSDTGD